MGQADAAFYLCGDPACHFRFPATILPVDAEVCPLCGAAATLVAPVITHPDETNERVQATGTRPGLFALPDNLRSIYNVGSIFRTADGAGFGHLFLCGITPTPHHPRLGKTALGAERAVAWSHHNNSIALAHRLHAQGHQLWVLEETPDATSLFSSELPWGTVGHGQAPLVLVVGNETVGVDPELLALADQTIILPMLGVKRSLNVATAFGIAAYLIAMHTLTNA